jgi:trans-AT polyketide synthase/acyltransferase/oxidoreductase domain-containing protein
MKEHCIIFPGQGTQFKGMGKELFGLFPDYVGQANEILGYALDELCLNGPSSRLRLTLHAQPAIFLVNALRYLQYQKQFPTAQPTCFMGHSLGEFNALWAAGAFDFETGIRLVQKRGQLMGELTEGSMLAVLGLEYRSLKKRLSAGSFDQIDIANFNTPLQIVLAGPPEDLNRFAKVLKNEEVQTIPLSVSAAFHSRYMEPIEEQFRLFLRQINFAPLHTPVLSNVKSEWYQDGKIVNRLVAQLSEPVKWTQQVQLLLGKGAVDFVELGPKKVLTKMIKQTRAYLESGAPTSPTVSTVNGRTKAGMKLGSSSFKKRYGTDWAYVAGAMYRGIASKELVISMARAGMLSFFGSGGLPMDPIRSAIREIQAAVKPHQPYGINFLHQPANEEAEMAQMRLYLEHQVPVIEASAFINITPALVGYRLKGLHRGPSGEIVSPHKIIAKLSRPEVAAGFLSPPPERMVRELRTAGWITEEEAQMAPFVSVANDITVEADSGGHTDMGIASVLVPAIRMLRDQYQEKHRYTLPIHVGAAGGIGTPHSAAAAFVLGADYILTGSINQCTVEAGAHEHVKDLLMAMNVQDTAYAPAGDMFELGAKIQVLKKGLLFPARGRKLFNLYEQHKSIEDIDPEVRARIEKNFFRKPLAEVWAETQQYYRHFYSEKEFERVARSPKLKMAAIFKWYFAQSTRFALEGNLERKVDFQVHSGPALGAFNQWLRGTEREHWRQRRVAEIGQFLMNETAAYLEERLRESFSVAENSLPL